MEVYPECFEPHTAIAFSEISSFCGQGHIDQGKTPYTTHIPDHVIQCVKQWDENTVAYMPWAIYPGHWAAVEVSIPHWKIRVYDCLVGYNYKEREYVKDYIRAFGVSLRRVFEMDARLRNLPQMLDPAKPPIAVKAVTAKYVPQMPIPGDCGVYTVKFIEHLMHKEDFSLIKADNMLLRHKMCVQLFHQYIDL